MNAVDVWRTCTEKQLRKSWEQRGSQAASLLTLFSTRAGLSASSKWEFNHGKHQHETVHRSSVMGCKCVEDLGQCYSLISRVKGKPFQGRRLKSIHGNTSALLLALRAAGFPSELPKILASCTHKPEDGEKYSNPCPLILQTGTTGLASNTYIYSLKILKIVKRFLKAR